MTSARLVLDDIDEIAVELAVKGQRSGPLNLGERYEAIREMHRLGYSDALMAARIGMTARNVLRDRQSLGIPEVPAHRRIEMDESFNIPRTAASPSLVSPIGKLLEDAGDHERARVRNLGARIEADLERLRALLAEDKERAKMLAEVERLKAALAEATARLKRGHAPSEPKAPRAASTRSLEPMECRKGCGKVSAGASGRAGHERFCQGEAKAS